MAAAAPSLRSRSASWTRTSAATVKEHLLAAGHHDLVQPQNALTVREAMPGRGDHVAGLERGLVPAVGFHAYGAGAADAPLLDGAIFDFDVETDHHVRVAPFVAGHRARDRHRA